MSDGTVVDIYEPVIADLKERIADLQATLENLERIRGNAAIGARLGLNPRVVGVTFDNDAFFGLTIAEAGRKYLIGIKKTATAKTIAEALVAGGFKTSAKNFVETVRSIVSRNPYFALVNGEFGLAEWYPGRKTGKRSPASEDVIVSHGAESSFVEEQRREEA